MALSGRNQKARQALAADVVQVVGDAERRERLEPRAIRLREATSRNAQNEHQQSGGHDRASASCGHHKTFTKYAELSDAGLSSGRQCSQEDSARETSPHRAAARSGTAASPRMGRGPSTSRARAA